MVSIKIDNNQVQKLQILFDTVLQVHAADVQGDVAEFGTDTGTTADVLALAVKTAGDMLGRHLTLHNMPPKHLHLFDSFEGLPLQMSEVDQQMPHVRSNCWSPGSMHTLTAEQLRERVLAHLPSDRVHIHKGWHAETVKTIAPSQQFAVIHGDSDLYESTRDYLDGLFAGGHIAEGAFICFDDYHCNRANPNLGERRAWRELTQKYNVEFSDFGYYGQTSHRFIVHSYGSAG